MERKRIAKILTIVAIVLVVKSVAFGWWHFGSMRDMAANVLLPIFIHILGGLGTIFLAWWLIDKDLRAQAKREEWERVFAKAYSDLRRDVLVATALREQQIAAQPSQIYARYWIEGLAELRLKLPAHESVLEHELWSLTHELDVCNQMLDDKSIVEASTQAGYVIDRIKALGPNLERLGKSLEHLEVEQPDFCELFAPRQEEKGFVSSPAPLPNMTERHRDLQPTA